MHTSDLMLQWLQAHGLYGVAAFMAAESAGAPLPTALGFATAEGLVDLGHVAYWEVFLFILVGHLIGAAVTYHLGRAGDSALTRRFAHRKHVVEIHHKMQHWYAKYGPLAILFGRLVGQVRPWASFVAGLARVPAFSFYLWTIVGTAIFTVITMWVTAVGYKYWLANPHLRAPLVIVLMVIFYGLPLYKGIEHLVKRKKRRSTPDPVASPREESDRDQ